MEDGETRQIQLLHEEVNTIIWPIELSNKCSLPVPSIVSIVLPSIKDQTNVKFCRDTNEDSETFICNLGVHFENPKTQMRMTAMNLLIFVQFSNRMPKNGTLSMSKTSEILEVLKD